MKYINAEQVFPEEVLKEIRKYVPEGYIYVPKQSVRKQWGSVSGSRQKLKKRNHEILLAYQTGKSVEELAQEYYLTTSSIYSILKQAI